MKALLGVLVKDVPRYLPALARNDASYLALCNRAEHLEAALDGSGYRCNWQWTSDLHAPKVLPILGHWLMKRALTDHPVRRLPQPELHSQQPEISFIIGHRGMERLPHLLATLESIAGQVGFPIECIVVEQEVKSGLGGKLPAWVHHIHTPPPAENMPYCRSWAFNVGAKAARGRVLVLHDNDLLIPTDYVIHIMQHVLKGYDVVNLKRFIFYLSERHSNSIFSGKAGLTDATPDSIMQNSEAGGSIAITRQTYDQIGGMDETFVGWGGEDNEFWERAQTLKVWLYGFLPLVHLWHPAGSESYRFSNNNLKRYQTLSGISVNTRIKQLRMVPVGETSGPAGWVGHEVSGKHR